MIDFSNNIVLVTGASAGIGEATAREFAGAGAKVILAARRLEKIQKLATELGSKAIAVQLDVRRAADVEKAISNLPTEFNDIDILVNNAGLSQDLLKLQEGRIDGWETMIDTNVKGLLFVTRAVLPGMVARGRGHVINIGSIAGHEVYPGGNVYCATKYAVRALTKSLLMDLVDTPVRVTSIDPGLVETEFSEVRFRGDSQRAKTVYQGYKPLEGKDIADAVVWAAARPAHVNIAEMIVLPKAQAAAMLTHKEA